MILINSEVVDIKKFPNRETLINTPYTLFTTFKTNLIDLKYEGDSDLISLMFLKRYADLYDFPTTLRMKYIPYSRMDRSENYSLFTFKYFADFINSLNFKSVIAWEPHSDVSKALINNLVTKDMSIGIAKSIASIINFNKEKDYIYFPDTTAQKRYGKYFADYNHLTGLKERNFETGQIKSLELIGTPKGEDFKVIMIDDLCSGGKTFIYGAEKLKEFGAGDIYLAVTHCEDNIYNGEIFKNDLIKCVYTTDSLLTNFSETNKLVVT